MTTILCLAFLLNAFLTVRAINKRQFGWAAGYVLSALWSMALFVVEYVKAVS